MILGGFALSDRAPLVPARLPIHERQHDRSPVDLLTRYTVAESRHAMLASFEQLEAAYAQALLVGV